LETNKKIGVDKKEKVGYHRCSIIVEKLENNGEIFPSPMWTNIEGFQEIYKLKIIYIGINGEHLRAQSRKFFHFCLKVCRKTSMSFIYKLKDALKKNMTNEFS
jgi:hypothetical protein